MVGFISFVARSMGDLDSFAVEKKIHPDVNVMSHTKDVSTKTANDAVVSSAVCLDGHVVCLATCARVWMSSQLMKTKPIVVSVYAKVCCGPYRFVFTCVRMLGGGGKCDHVALSEQLSMPYLMVPNSIGRHSEILQLETACCALTWTHCV